MSTPDPSVARMAGVVAEVNRSPARTAPPKRMTLSSVVTGPTDPWRVLLYGEPTVGKSTFGASAPAPIFLGAEDGTGRLDVPRFPPAQTWRDVLDALRELTEEPHAYKTIVIDTLDSLEPLVYRHVVGRDPKAENIEQVGGGFQKGYVVAVDEWRVFLTALERLHSATGMKIILLAHAAVVKFKNPEGSDYGKFSLKLEQRSAPVFVEWSDMCLFGQFETWTEEERGKRPRGASTDMRLMRTRRTAAYDAKNRYSLPQTMPMCSWDELMAAVRAGADPATLRAAIEAGIEKLAGDDAEKAKAALARAGEDATKLAQLENWISGKAKETR